MTDVVIIGAGPAGLACAAELKQKDLSVCVLEKSEAVASSWRNHYERLHLHTGKGRSGLPGMEMPEHYPLYPSRLQVVEYMDEYARKFGIEPVLNTAVDNVRRDNGFWSVNSGISTWQAKAVVIAAGNATNPKRPNWPGMETFPGTIIHSDDYVNTKPYKDKRVLVVGFGNSGGEISLDLAEQGIDCTLSVRKPVRILPRDLFGVPIQSFGLLQRFLPYKVVDAINAPVLHAVIGSYEKLGLRKAKKGPLTMIREDRRIPLIDIGTLKAIRQGKIRVTQGIEGFKGSMITFADGSMGEFDAVILATGFKADLRPLLGDDCTALNEGGTPIASGEETSEAGLYFCGYRVVPSGLLMEIGKEAKELADIIPLAIQAGSIVDATSKSRPAA